MSTSKKKKSTKPKPVKSLAEIPADAAPETKRPVQTEIPGTERVKIEAIDTASEEYVNARDKRMSATVKEVATKKALSDLMHKHADDIGRTPEGALIYLYDDMKVTLTPKEEVLKVKHVEAEDTGVVTVGAAPEDNSEGEA